MVHAGIIPAQWQSVVDELHEARRQVSRLEKVVRDLAADVERLEQELMKAGTEIGHREADIKELKDENQRLRGGNAWLDEVLDEWNKCGDAIMLAVTGKSATLSDSDVIGEFEKLKEENRRLRERSPMTVEEICERADAAEEAARRAMRIVEAGGKQAETLVGDPQQGVVLGAEQSGGMPVRGLPGHAGTAETA